MILPWVAAFFVSGAEEILMHLIVNGTEKLIEDSANLTQLLKELEIDGQHIAVALNLQVIPRSSYEATSIKDGDKVEIVHAVGGG